VLTFRALDIPKFNMRGPDTLLPSVEDWLRRTEDVESAVLFGSSARPKGEQAAADAWSDFDLHVICRKPKQFEHLNWRGLLPGQDFRFQVVRPATGGVRKATLFFATGQVDLVLVPAWQLWIGRAAFQLNIHHRFHSVNNALNEVSTCVRSGYRFLKGEAAWGKFYGRVASDMPGVRISDTSAKLRADVSVADVLWVLQKIQRGELCAAQHLLHSSISAYNFALVRESRLRRGLPVPSFGLGRRVETLMTPAELAWVQVDARLVAVELEQATWRALSGLEHLMKTLVPDWKIERGMSELLAVHRRAAD
jgi:hypothetical protein